MKIKMIDQRTICAEMENSNLEAITVIPVTEALDVCPEHTDLKPELRTIRNKSFKLPPNWKKAIIEIRLRDVE